MTKVVFGFLFLPILPRVSKNDPLKNYEFMGMRLTQVELTASGVVFFLMVWRSWAAFGDTATTLINEHRRYHQVGHVTRSSDLDDLAMICAKEWGDETNPLSAPEIQLHYTEICQQKFLDAGAIYIFTAIDFGNDTVAKAVEQQAVKYWYTHYLNRHQYLYKEPCYVFGWDFSYRYMFYTQLLWKSSQNIGFGFSQLPNTHLWLIVVFFEPKGNVFLEDVNQDRWIYFRENVLDPKGPPPPKDCPCPCNNTEHPSTSSKHYPKNLVIVVMAGGLKLLWFSFTLKFFMS